MGGLGGNNSSSAGLAESEAEAEAEVEVGAVVEVAFNSAVGCEGSVAAVGGTGAAVDASDGCTSHHITSQQVIG